MESPNDTAEALAVGRQHLFDDTLSVMRALMAAEHALIELAVNPDPLVALDGLHRMAEALAGDDHRAPSAAATAAADLVARNYGVAERN